MAKNKEKLQISPEVREEAMRVAQATKKPGQTKEQTKLIAQGIQKGIAQYKKQQKLKEMYKPLTDWYKTHLKAFD